MDAEKETLELCCYVSP